MSRIGNLSSRIFVGGLDPIVDESDLQKAFALFGEITNVMVMRDRENGRSRGFAFISFKDSMSSEDAISRMHGVEIRGRCVTVRHAERERFLDDKTQTGSTGPVRGKGGPVAVTPIRNSQYDGYKYQVSKTVFVTDDDQDYSRGNSYKRGRSSSPGNPRYSSNVGTNKPVYRERSPHYHYDRDNVQISQRAYYEDNSSNTAGRLSPTEELSAYANSRYKDYSPQLDFGKQRTDSADYRKSGIVNQDKYRSYTGQSSPRQEHSRSRYDQQRHYRSCNDRRHSPDMHETQKLQGSYGQDYTESQLGRNDTGFRDERRPRNTSDSRRTVAERHSPQRVPRSRNYARDKSPDRNASWDRNKQQRTPQNSYREWNQGGSKTGRDQRRDRTNEDFQRGRNEDFQRGRRSDLSESRKIGDTSNGDGSRWNRDSRHSNSYQSRDSSYNWKEQQRDPHQDRCMPSTQSWKKESFDRGRDRSKDIQRLDEYRSSADYRKSRYQGEDKEHARSSESYRGGSGRSQSGHGQYQNNRGRRY